MTVHTHTATATVATRPRVLGAIVREGAGMDTGYITRANLPSPFANLDLFAIDTDTGVPIYDFSADGLDPGSAPQRRQVVAQQWVPGAGQLGSVPGMASATYSFTVTAVDGVTLDQRIGELVTAVYNQSYWELHVLFEGTREWAWSNWKSDEPQIGFTAALWGPGPEPYMWAPVTVTTMRDPILVAGPYQPA